MVRKTFGVVVLAAVMALLGVTVVVLRLTETRDRTLRTVILLRVLQDACKACRMDYGAYPPGAPDFDSRTLHRHLGSPRQTTSKDGTVVRRPPIYEFVSRDLLGHPSIFRADRPLPIVDEWDRPIRYSNPGRFNKDGIDLWTAGRGGYPPDDSRFDGITNWQGER